MFPLILLSSFFVVINANASPAVVQISSGLIQGEYVQSKATENYFYSFRGIPYAEAPIGKLRFQAPVKRKPWKGTLETKKDGSYCVQEKGGSEDCLYLNVYTSTLPTNEEKSELMLVMVYVHGGAFVHGSSRSSYLGPDYLVEKGVILVTFNYRLNIFGFLNAMDESAPGNVGLKDQLLVLEWVQENIESFNGNKNKVTVFGHSAGSAAVQYLLQSKLAKGLFHGAIMQSGSTLNAWSFEKNPLTMIQKLSIKLNIKDKNITEVVNRLKELSAEEIFNTSTHKDVMHARHMAIYQRFVPSIEINSPKAFITENSFSLLTENKINSVPIIMGCTSNEALFTLSDITEGKLVLSEEYEKNPSRIVPSSLNIRNDFEREQFVLDEIRKYYFNNGSFDNVTGYFHFRTDDIFARGIKKSADLLRKNNDIYYYLYDYKDERHNTQYAGVPHVAELQYIFYTGVDESAEAKLLREKLTTLWTNFAKTWNPTPVEDPVLDNIKWPKVSRGENDKFDYLYIGEQLTIKENPNQENNDFWENIFKKYGQPPFFTF